jgi:hypothetical protein
MRKKTNNIPRHRIQKKLFGIVLLVPGEKTNNKAQKTIAVKHEALVS